MEEIPAHVYPSPIVSNVLMRQHEHRSGFIWSGDHKTCITNLQFKCFDRDLFQAYSTAPPRLAIYSLISRAAWFTSATSVCWRILRPPVLIAGFVLLPYQDRGLVESDMWRAYHPERVMRQGNDHTYWGPHHASHLKVRNQWRQHIRDGTMLLVEELSNSRDYYIRWYRDITRVYIGNPANRDTRTVGYQAAGVDRWMKEVGDMATEVIQEPPSSPTQIASFAKKVRLAAIASPSPRARIENRGACGVKKGTRRLSGGGARGGRAPIPPDMGGGGHVDPRRGRRDLGSSDHGDPFDSPNLGMPSFSLGLTPPTQSYPSGLGTSFMPLPLSLGFFHFGHLILRTDEVTPAQQLGFGHRVGKKTIRFTPSDWPYN
ncbi:hypothetical protein M9H77_06782 [Catharanthus roseus]|uniref:Uncharacterized protein n=1 Tax=Catharanthus roseus TaxID=4058 RepID=A0ACC0BT27_CATRO|nr:hypothetical protein M9H77_06782 [Catharanthus roseus]